MEQRNLIIGGVSKSGTTSVFRYLCAHPDIKPSIRKELSYFFVHKDAHADALCSGYARYFDDAESGVFLEASPRYLQDGTDVARAIKRALPDVRLLFLLRDPAERLGSYYRSKFRTGQRVGTDMDFTAFVDLALGVASEPVDALDQALVPIKYEVERGLYGEHLGQYLREFPSEQIMIGFFEMLQSDPRALMRAICQFAALDGSIYDEFDFTVENRSRIHRWNWLRRIAGRLNQRFEPWLNESPEVKRVVRKAYDMLNVDSRKIRLAESDKARLRLYYKSSNDDLRRLLRQNYQDITLPAWLSRQDG